MRDCLVLCIECLTWFVFGFFGFLFTSVTRCFPSIHESVCCLVSARFHVVFADFFSCLCVMKNNPAVLNPRILRIFFIDSNNQCS